MESTPAVLAEGLVEAVIRDLIQQARTCAGCGQVHEYRNWKTAPGGTWAGPDGHSYRPASGRAATWLESRLTAKVVD